MNSVPSSPSTSTQRSRDFSPPPSSVGNNNPTTSTSIHIHQRRHGHTEPTPQEFNYPEYEKSCTKELQWLLRTTSSIIGNEAPSIGKLPRNTIRKYPLIMRAWARRCSIPHLQSNAAHVVERLLERLLEERDNGNKAVEKEGVICTNIYNIMLEAWANTSGKKYSNTIGDDEKEEKENYRVIAAKRAHGILNQMEDLSGTATNSSVVPDGKSYYLALKAWVRSREYYAVDEMERILCRMEDLGLYNAENDVSSSGGNIKTSANTRSVTKCYNLYLYALANRKSKYNPKVDAKKAYSILLGLKEKSMVDGVLTFNTNTYNQVLSTFAKMQNFEGASEAQSIFDDMLNEANATNVHPDTNTFNTLMNCWLKSGPRGRQHVEKLLNTMVEMSANGHEVASPDRFSVNTAIAAVAKSGRKDSVRKAYFMLMNMEDLFNTSPDTTSYNLLLSAYARSRDLQAGKKAQKLLKEMEDLYMKGNVDIVPDSFTYSTVIDAVSSPSKAEKVMNRMRHIFENYGGREPDVVVYNALLNAYSTCGEDDSVYQTRDILHYMEESYKAGNEKLKPNIISYNTVLKAYSNAQGDFTKEANELLCEMERMYKSGETDVAPDVISYTTVISSYSRSEVTQKARVAQGVLQKMIDAYNHGNLAARPSVYSFNSCLNACAFTFDQEEKVDAFLVAVSTLALLQEWTKPDHTTYGTLLKAWCNLIPKDDERRHRIVNSMFRQCCKDGQVGSMVLRQLRYAASPALYKTLVGRSINEEVELCDLPSRWSRNVKERNGKISRTSR